jgi:hypothetical protein
MQALIGKIIKIEPQPGTVGGMTQAVISFTATAGLAVGRRPWPQ